MELNISGNNKRNQFYDKGHAQRKSGSGRKPSVVTDKLVADIQRRIKRNPDQSRRAIARELKISDFTVRRVIKKKLEDKYGSLFLFLCMSVCLSEFWISQFGEKKPRDKYMSFSLSFSLSLSHFLSLFLSLSLSFSLSLSHSLSISLSLFFSIFSSSHSFSVSLHIYFSFCFLKYFFGVPHSATFIFVIFL